MSTLELEKSVAIKHPHRLPQLDKSKIPVITMAVCRLLRLVFFFFARGLIEPLRISWMALKATTKGSTPTSCTIGSPEITTSPSNLYVAPKFEELRSTNIYVCF